MATPILDVKNLRRTVMLDNQPRTIIDDISFSFCRRKIYAVIGPSGAGKSSFLRLLNRLDEPDSGEVLFHGKSHLEYTPCQLRKKVGYLFQTPYLFDGTVRDNLLYANADLTDDEVETLAREAHIKAEQVNQSTTNFSVGEKQRVAIARLLATRPEVILLDEPTSALDPGYTSAIEELIKEIVPKQDLAAIVVTHNPEQALRIGQEALLMHSGKLIESGPVEQIINDPQSEAGMNYKTRKLL